MLKCDEHEGKVGLLRENMFAMDEIIKKKK